MQKLEIDPWCDYCLPPVRDQVFAWDGESDIIDHV